MNPTVSVTRISCVLSSTSDRVVVSRVENSMASSSIPASVRAFKRLLLPAEVYPTRAAVFSPDCFLCERTSSLCFSTSFSSRFSLLMRSRMRRRSISSFFSPGPLVPMPPPRRDRDFPSPASLDARYLS